MATSGDLAKAVAGYMRRKQEDFQKSGFDNLLQACNNARLYAERQIDFELSRVSVDFPNISLTNGGSMDSAVLHSDGTTPVSLKKIKRPFVNVSTGQVAPFPVAFYSRDAWLKRVQRNWERLQPIAMSYPPASNVAEWQQQYFGSISEFSVVQMGRTLMLSPSDPKTFNNQNTITLYADVLAWLPAYGTTVITGTATGTTGLTASASTFITSGVRIGSVVRNTTSGASATVTSVLSQTALQLSAEIFASGNTFSINVMNESDYLLSYCFDWLMYRSIEELNFFLKEDERVQLSASLVSSAWEAVRSWNENLISQSVDDSDLS